MMKNRIVIPVLSTILLLSGCMQDEDLEMSEEENTSHSEQNVSHTYIGETEKEPLYKINVSPIFKKVPDYEYSDTDPSNIRFHYIPQDIEYEYKGRNMEGLLEQIAILEVFSIPKSFYDDTDFPIENWKNTKIETNEMKQETYTIFEKEDSNINLDPYSLMIKTEKKKYVLLVNWRIRRISLSQRLPGNFCESKIRIVAKTTL